jgi:hypothetical protein
MQPPITALLALQEQVPALGVKVMPGVADAELPAGCSVEFISHAGVCKEAVLWFGPARSEPKRALLLPKRLSADAPPCSAGVPVCTAGGACGDACAPIIIPGDPAGDAPPLGPLAAGQVLYEPDCALIRAGCLAELCRRLDAHLFDPEIAYLISERLARTPATPTALAQAFWVEEVHPFSLKLLNARLGALGVAGVELKKRGFPQEPESLRPRLKLQRAGRNAVVLLTRRGDEHVMILGRRA